MDLTGNPHISELSADPLANSVPFFDPAGLPLRGWCAGSREDAVTGLVAFPDFHSHIPRAFAATLLAGGVVGLAIGDVDGLKSHVEQTNATEPGSFGHLAGNKVMAKLGSVARDWFHAQPWEAACAATFGGDEVIIAAALDDAQSFHHAVRVLRDRLGNELPVTVSFALAFATAEDLPADRETGGWKHAFADRLLATVDRCLFAHKATRRADGRDGGIIAVTQPPPESGQRARDARALLPLPGPGDSLRVLAHPTQVGTRTMLALPCAGPPGLRGKRLRAVFPDGGARTTVAVTTRRHAAIPQHVDTAPDSAVPLTLLPVRDRSGHTVPHDLAAKLAAAGLDWAVLPTHEQTQMLHLVAESATRDIRSARILAAVDAVAARTRS